MCARRAPASRRGHRGRNWLVGILVLVGVLVAADRITVVVAERAAASTIRSAQHLESTPSVRIGGFPFLTQLITTTLADVDVRVNDVVAGAVGRTIRIAHLDAHLYRVHISGFHSARAETVTASALIDYTALSSTLGVAVSYAGPSADGAGRVQATQSMSVLDQQVTGTGSAEVAVTGSNVLEFIEPRATVGGVSVPAAVVAALTNVFSRSIELRRLPFGLAVATVRANAAGVTFVLTGTNVTYQ